MESNVVGTAANGIPTALANVQVRVLRQAINRYANPAGANAFNLDPTVPAQADAAWYTATSAGVPAKRPPQSRDVGSLTPPPCS